VSRCFVELYKHLPKDVQACIALRENDNAYIRELGIIPPDGYDYDKWIIRGNWPAKGKLYTAYNWIRGEKYYWDKTEYNKQFAIKKLKAGDYDVFHPTYFDDYFLPYLSGKPFVLTIHDMIPERYPQYFNQERDKQIIGKKKLAPLASAIIAVSENTKSDVVNILKVPEEKVHVAYHGCSFRSVDNPQCLMSEPYILYVGDRKCYKNFPFFVRDVAPVVERHPSLRVICTGLEFNKDEVNLLRSFGVEDRFVYRWVRTDEEFYSLYHYARCFIYTSEYEGFGIPILEAYQADCPVLLNRASCFPEIAGDAAVYFTLKPDGSNLTDVMMQFLSMPDEELKDLKRRQRARLSRYSWQKSAEQLAVIYQGIMR
jgi:glycosyltransferase involved in cell wall biosynthesis